MKAAPRPLSRRMTYCLDVVSIGVEHKSTVIVRMVVRAQSRGAIVRAARGERRAVELIHRCPILRHDRNVQGLVQLPFAADPKIEFAIGTEPSDWFFQSAERLSP